MISSLQKEKSIVKQKITLDEFNRRNKIRKQQENIEIIDYDGYAKPAKIRCEHCNIIILIN